MLRILTLVAIAAVAPAVVGCGGSSSRAPGKGASTSAPSSTGASSGARSTQGNPEPAQRGGRERGLHPERAPTVLIKVSVPTVKRGEVRYLAARYTCDGADMPPAIKWSGVPSGTAELVLFVLNLRPVENRLFFDWAVAGLDPASNGIPRGGPPAGAVVGRNSFGKAAYSICPAKSAGGERFVFALIALPRRLAAKRGFDAERLYREAERTGTATGLDGGAYARS